MISYSAFVKTFFSLGNCDQKIYPNHSFQVHLFHLAMLKLPHNSTSQAFTKDKSYESSRVLNCESQKVTSIIFKMGTNGLLKFSFEMFLG